MKELLEEYIEDNFIDAETLGEIAENMTSYEVDELWKTVKSMAIRTNANKGSLNKYR